MSTNRNDRTTKTTVYLDAADYERLKLMARSQGRPAAELVREAVAEYARRNITSVLPRSLGSGRSGRRDLADRVEDLLFDSGEG